jgi:hypothetical protein
MECFSKLEKAVKKTQKSSRKKKCCQEYSDSSDSDSEKDNGYGSTVGSRSNKRSKIDICVTPPSPDKTTVASKITSTSKKPNHNKIKHPPLSDDKGKVTAVVTMAKYVQAHHHKSSKKVTKEKLIRVLLDSGSVGDLLFHQKGKPKHSPYLTRQVPCSWHTSNGVFQTKGRGKLSIRFFKYRYSKEFLTEPDVFEYNRKMGKPVFDLIIGCNSMEKLGIVLDFKAKSITIDETILLMKNINIPTNLR